LRYPIGPGARRSALPRERFSPLTQRRHPGASPQRERRRVLKILFDETGLKSPIFYSEDFAIDGAAMPEKLCAM